jgi:divalent metal cation (Fe/Co/Zn/Cd) transporter
MKDPKWTRIALWLVSGTMAYNIAEGIIATWAGAKAESVALFGFGLDSGIECAAAAVMLWRLYVEATGADREKIEASEKRVRRFIGATFLALALYVALRAGFDLYAKEQPGTTTVGIVLAAASLAIMPTVSWAKLKAAGRIGSPALRAEAKETLACSYLSFTLLLGLAANSAFRWWWADPMAALLMVPWLIKEGLEGVRGDDSCDDD